MSESSARADYFGAAEGVADLIAAIPEAAAWARPALGNWDLLALVGHVSRSLVLVRQYLDQPALRVDVDGPAGYYLANAAAPAVDDGAVETIGRTAGRALLPDPAAAFRGLVAELRLRLDGVADDVLITTLAGGMRLTDFLPTRTFEFVVHGRDIARSAGLTFELPVALTAGATALAAEIGAGRGQGPAILDALTGRGGLPTGFSVL